MNIYNNQNFTFKLIIQFSFMLIKVNYEGFNHKIQNRNNIITVSFDLHYASTNTRLKGFENPVVVDNKKDIDNIIKRISQADFIEIG